MFALDGCNAKELEQLLMTQMVDRLLAMAAEDHRVQLEIEHHMSHTINLLKKHKHELSFCFLLEKVLPFMNQEPGSMICPEF